MLKFVFQFAGDNLIDWLLLLAVPVGGPAPVPVLAEAKGKGDGATVRVACEVSLGVG